MKDSRGKYKFFPHTADAKFEAYGSSLEELFTNAGKACFAIITDVKKVKPERDYEVEVSAKRLDSLLFDFLDAILFLLDTEGFLLHECQDMKIEKKGELYHCSCIVFGDYHKDYDVSCNVKAVTYSDMEIKETEKGWQATVVVDL